MLCVALQLLAAIVTVERRWASEGGQSCTEAQSLFHYPGLSSDELITVDVSNSSAHCSSRVIHDAKVELTYEARDGEQLLDVVRLPNRLYIELGHGDAIDGFEMALLGLCEGEVASFTLPSALAWGDRGGGTAVRDARLAGRALHFDVAVRRVVSPPVARAIDPPLDLFDHIDLDGDGRLSADEVSQHFARLRKPVPPALWSVEDADRDRFIARAEFRGPKRSEAPPDALGSAERCQIAD